MTSTDSNERVSLSNHLPQLDGLRAIAALMVVVVHWVYHGEIFGTPWGDIGVQLFFVLSGFLITRILLMIKCTSRQTTARSLRQFYIRRALRIFPLYYTSLFVLAFLNVATFQSAFGWHATYFSNVYFYFHGFGGDGAHFWTLSVEEQFYTAFPLLILLAPKRMVCPLILSLVAMAPLFRFVAGSGHAGGLSEGYWLQLPSSLDSLCCGAFIAWLERYKGKLTQVALIRAMFWAGFGIYVCCVLFPSIGVLKKTCVGLILSWVVHAGANRMTGPIGRILESDLLASVGRYSYGIYVIHAFAPSIWLWLMYQSPLPGYRIAFRLGIPEWLYDNWFAQRFCWSMLTTVLVVASYRCLETPLNNLKKHFPYN